ncbi:hypothetical protein PR048_002238 [Dryococelus australis]|uniref:Polyprotein n=1 Tax=Dryococelus australis TaxID=614101 RepID=A0ABQ9IJQ6_9NEOP|nr:hypothetical protein PR048_002238 [Dryococelus australis]
MSDNYADILFPLVESCLPLETLRHWERVNSDFDYTLKEQLDGLIVVVRREVQAEERVATDHFVTISDLANVKPAQPCYLYIGYHGSAVYRKAFNMTHDEKRTLLTKTGCCFACSKREHLAWRCRLKFSSCGVRHILLNLRTFVAILHKGDIYGKIRGLIDTGSQRYYISGSLAGEMNYFQIGEEHLIQSLLGGYSMRLSKHSCYEARLRGLAIPSVVIQIDLKKLGIHLIEDMPGPVGVLIGADVAGKNWSSNRVVLSTGFAGVETLFCGTIMGTERSLLTNLAISFTMATVLRDMSQIYGNSKPLTSVIRLRRTYDLVRELPTNLQLAKERLVRVTKKMRHTPRLFEEYDSVFFEWLRLNIIKKSEEDVKGHYLLHRPVFKETSSTTKVYPVLDASANISRYPSFTDCSEQCPNLIELLPEISQLECRLTSKRHFYKSQFIPRIAITSNSCGDELITLKHSHVVFGVTCSPFLLEAVLYYHLNRCMEECFLGDSRFYVDNLATSVDDIGEAKKGQALATKIMAQGGFNLRGWEFSGDTSEELAPILDLNGIASPIHSASMSIDGRRKVQSMTQRVNDPIGFNGPAILSLKLMLQTLWENKLA